MLWMMILCVGASLHADTTTIRWDRAVPFSASIITAATIGQIKQASTYWRTPSPFYINNGDDLYYASGADKLGHAYVSYAISVLIREGMIWSGFDQIKATWIGAGFALAHQTLIEYRDATSIASDGGYYPYLGWSWTDIAANILGIGLAVVQSYSQNHSSIINSLRMKYSYHSSGKVSQGYYGSALDDYESQYHWICLPLTVVVSDALGWWGKFLGIGVGHCVRDIVSAPGQYTYAGKHEVWLTLDYNLEAIEVNSSLVPSLLRVLNLLRLPAPCIRLTPPVAAFGLRW